MASTGAAAWAKYYQGKGDLPTTIKRSGNAYDEDGKATSTILAEGTPVLVLSMKAYDSKPHIRVTIGGTAKTVRFKFDDLVKPGNKASACSYAAVLASTNLEVWQLVKANLVPGMRWLLLSRTESFTSMWRGASACRYYG